LSLDRYIDALLFDANESTRDILQCRITLKLSTDFYSVEP
jgi:hypothetical protein